MIQAMATRPLTEDVADLEAKVSRGERLSGEELVRLFRSPDILAVGRMATMVWPSFRSISYPSPEDPVPG